MDHEKTAGKSIWSAWFQGRGNAPRHVQRIFRLWEELNPDYELYVVEEMEMRRLLDGAGVANQRLSPQVRADLVRSMLLKERGGVWVDATLLPARPLSEWIDNELGVSGFFAFHSTGDPNLVLQNWFLASVPEHPLMQAWCDSFTDYFRSQRLYPSLKRALWHGKLNQYFKFRKALRKGDMSWFADPARGRNCVFYPYSVHNYCLAHLLATSSEAKAEWEAVPCKWNLLPTVLAQAVSDKDTPDSSLPCITRELLPVAPVHKLNHRDPRHDLVVTAARDYLGLGSD